MSSEWSASGDGWAITWRPQPPHLSGSPDVVREVERRLAAQDVILATPTGPLIASDPAEPLAVLVVLREAAGSPVVETDGDVPAVPALPEGAVG